MEDEHQESQEVTSGRDNGNPALSKANMNGIGHNRSHGVARERRKEDERHYGVVDMIVFFEIRYQSLPQAVSMWKVNPGHGVAQLTPYAPSFIPNIKNE